ncbi:MAG: hypothetical protein WEA09_04270 [Gemmatimonadota bacterium]
MIHRVWVALGLFTMTMGGTLLTPLPVGAQVAPYLLMGGRGHELAESLRARGFLPSLSPLDRPYRADRVRAALSGLDESDLSPLELSWAVQLDSLLTHLAPVPGEGSVWRLAAAPGAHTGSSANRDPVFQWGPAGSWGHLVLEGSLSAGPVAVHTMPRVDARPVYDLRFQGLRDPWGARLSIREEAAYAVAELGPVTLLGGRLGRTWGPVDRGGLLLTDLEYNYDQLSWSAQWRGFRATQLVGALDRVLGVSRYLVAHRLEGPLPQGGAWAVSRSHVRATRQRLSRDLLDPTHSPGSNDLLSLEALQPVWPGGEVFGQLLLDRPTVPAPLPAGDVPMTSGPRAGDAWAWEAGIRDMGGLQPLDLELTYTRVPAQAYRPVQNSLELYTFWNTGLGADRSDFDRVLLRVGGHVNPYTRLTLELERHRQGGGDPRLLRARVPGNPGQDPPVLLASRISLDARVRVGSGGELRTRWGPIHRGLRVWAPDVPEGWRLEGWLMYRHTLSVGGSLQGGGP